MTKFSFNPKVVPFLQSKYKGDYETLKNQIKEAFEAKFLYKGSAEVVDAIDNRKQISNVFLVESADPTYKESLYNVLKATEADLEVIILDKNSKDLVYKTIKDLDHNPEKKSIRTKSRTYFKTFMFAY